MNKSIPMVRKLQADAIDQVVRVSSLLRTAKVIATKLELEDALFWIDKELDGYMDVPIEELPPYRRITGDLRGHNPFHGWQPIIIPDPELARAWAQAPMGSSIGALEEDLKNLGDRGSVIGFNLAPEVKAQIIGALEHPVDVQLRLASGAIYNIVEAVRNLLLNWCLELEKAGILGDEMEFSQEEKSEAVSITQQIFAQNIGVVGNVEGQAQVASQQSATMAMALDLAALQDFVGQARQALPLFPGETRNQLEPRISDLEQELGGDAPDQSRLRELMGSVRPICEGAAGNLGAQGILGLLKDLF